MDKKEFIYRMKYLNWRELLTIDYAGHTLTVRCLIDEGGKLYPPLKPLRYDVVIDGVVGPDAGSLHELDRIMRRNFSGVVAEMWRYAWRHIVREVVV